MASQLLQRLMAEADGQEAAGGPSKGAANGSQFVVALIQNRANEVGLAALDLSRMELRLTQFVEQSRSFALTLTMLELHPPAQLVLLGGSGGGRGAAAVATAEASPDSAVNCAVQALGVPVIALPRSCWDDTRGYVAVCGLASPATRPDIEAAAALASNYLAFGAAGALLRHVEQGQGQVLAAGSLAVRCGASPLHMHIDRASMRALELVQPLGPGSSGGGGGGGPWKEGGRGRKGPATLFQLLNHTKTRCGARMLRASLLQPLCDVATLNLRHDCVEELLDDDEMLFNVSVCLAKMPADMDRVCASLSLRPAKSEGALLRRIATTVHAFILLRELLSVLPALADALAPARCELLRALGATAGHAGFADLAAQLDDLLEEGVASSRNTFLNRIQQCFAVRKGRDGMLDVARAAFSRLTEQIHDLAARLREQHGLPHLRAQYTARRGFYFSLSLASRGRKGGKRGGEDEGGDDEAGGERSSWAPEPSGASPPSQAARAGGGGARGGGGQQRPPQQPEDAGSGRLRIPPGFSVLSSNGRSAQLTTHELNALNARLRDASNDCLVLTEQVLEALAQRILTDYLHLLHRLVDATALLDMLAGFAQLVAGSARSYVRPTLTAAGPTAIVEGRHPVLEAGEGGAAVQPNDAFLSLASSFHVITGPNMSGKSTFLRQVALTVVMAQVGCFVPAAFASLAPHDRLLARVGTGDSLETNSSSFMVEMQELAHILREATPRSLVLVDELGRATSTADGLGLAWAAAEALIARGCPTLFATHFGQCAELSRLYPCARAWHLAVSTEGNRLDYCWRVEAGTSSAGHYGLALARLVGFPEGVLAKAAEVVAALDEREAARAGAYASEEAAGEGVAASYGVAHKLACVAEAYSAGGDERAMLRQLRALRAEAAAAAAAAGASGAAGAAEGGVGGS